MDTYAFHFVPPAPRDDDREELLGLARWVVDVFDRATLQAAENADALEMHLAQANAEADAILLRSEQQPGHGAHVLHHHNRLRRLSQLAPAAVAWVVRHAQPANQDCWDAFRHHLVVRCEAIIRECPHADTNDE